MVGIPLAYLLARHRLRARSLIEGSILLPLVLPPTVIGYYLLVTLGKQGPFAHFYHSLTGHEMPPVAFTWHGIVLAASIVSAPLLVRTVQVAFASIDIEILEAARTMGASSWQIFYSIVLPLSRRGLIAGIGLAFARALGDFGATLMIGGNIPGLTHTLPLAVYDAMNAGEDRTALYYVILLSVICLIFSFCAAHLERD